MEKKKQTVTPDFSDLLHTQIVAISKARAYDVLVKRVDMMESKLKQILIHASEENQSIAKEDGKFGADELQAIRIKAKQALNPLSTDL